MYRRTFIANVASLPALALAGSLPEGAVAKERTVTAEQWMDRWMALNRAPGGLLQVGRFKDPMYFLLKSISWTPNKGQEQYAAVEVPVGFVTDFASVPRAFWSFLRPDGDYAYAAVIHDYLYWTQARPREAADQVLRMAMQDFGIERAVIETIFRAVRAGGGSAWSQNARLRSSGERRVLKVFPTDPTTNWKDWKNRPDVFADT